MDTQVCVCVCLFYLICYCFTFLICFFVNYDDRMWGASNRALPSR